MEDRAQYKTAETSAPSWWSQWPGEGQQRRRELGLRGEGKKEWLGREWEQQSKDLQSLRGARQQLQEPTIIP